jgi:hypothetical protein
MWACGNIGRTFRARRPSPAPRRAQTGGGILTKGQGGRLLARILSADGGIEGLHLGTPPLGFGAFAEAKVPADDFKIARRHLAA